ncbi:MAG: ABC transporter permease [Alphaproteobacteria bacterium]
MSATATLLAARRLRIDGWTFLACAVAIPVALPVLVVLSHVFAPFGEVWGHLAATVLPRYVANTVWLMLGVGTGVLVIGVSTAWLVTMCRFPGRRIFEWALLLPIAMPAYVIAYTYTGLLDVPGPVQTWLRATFHLTRQDYWFPPIRSLGGAIAMLTLVLYPYVYLLARAAFLSQSVAALEVSRTLGRGAWHSFLHVALPLARPGIAAGLALVLMEVLNDFGTVQFFAVDTFSTGIYRTWLALGSPTAAAQLSAILMLFIFAVLALERWSRGTASFHHGSTRYQRLPSYPLKGIHAGGAFLACVMPPAIGFAIPVSALLKWAIEGPSGFSDARFLRFAGNSLVLATVAGALVVALALAVTYGLRLRPSRLGVFAARLASTGYAVPGSVVAVGVLLPFGWFDNALDAWTRANLGVSTGLVLSGTIAAVIFAYLVRFFAVAFNSVEAGFAKVTGNMEAAARVLGRGPLSTLARVHLPMVWGSVLTASMLVFVDVMKELPATLMIRPFNFDTLAIRVYELVGDEQLRAASAPALMIVLAGLMPVIMLSRGIARSRPGHDS